VPVSSAVAALLLAAGAAPVAAAPGHPPREPIIVVGAADQYEIIVTDPGGPGSAGSAGAWRERAGGPSGRADAAASAGRQRCFYFPKDSKVVRWGLRELDASDRSRGTWWYVVCRDGYADLHFVPTTPTAPAAAATPSPGNLPTPEELARQAADQLPLGRPDVRTAPPRGTPALVNLPALVWLPARSWGERISRAQAGDVWAEATARPRVLTVAAAGVGQVACDGPGAPYTPDAPADCALTFRRPGRYRLTVTVQWGGTWRGSGGARGLLPTLETRAALDVDVVEARAVLVPE
jgi:hypothetical protein